MTTGDPKAPDGRQARWDRHNRERRQVILDAAIAEIAAAPPGADVRVQQIAVRAGLSRTVLYRHFTDRADLDRAVQSGIVGLIRRRIAPALTLEGAPVAIIRRVVAAYVSWAAEHPSLLRFAERQVGSGVSAMDEAIQEIAAQIEQLLSLAVEVLDVRLEESARAALDPLVFGLVGAGVESVRRWLDRPVRAPATDDFVDLLTEVVWHQISGMTAARGLVLDPDVPVEQLVLVPTDSRPA